MIEFKNINVSFRHKKSEVAAVRDVSFTINTGEIFGIVGSSGAGKSTLLRTINLLQKPTEGKIIIDGDEIENYKGEKLRLHRQVIGMIFQHFNLAESKTVYQNIAFVLKAAGKTKVQIDERVKELRSLVKLEDKMNTYPSQLSGGQKQRVAIARALANDAKILLCDEPTSALDLETTSAILKLIKELNEKMGITVVIITHELEVIKSICHKVAIMNNGELVETGNVYDVFTDPKAAFTRQLISYTTKFELPLEILEKTQGLIIKLTYKGENATDPVLSDTAKNFGISFNILLGKIEYISGIPLGVLYVQLIGKKEGIKASIDYLNKNTALLEVLKNE
ncbi:MAG: methionine transporter ATP-binding protein [Clostridia bacterium]|nr:methionine transporter ATP-binding protein [Clostridia bacterium]